MKTHHWVGRHALHEEPVRRGARRQSTAGRRTCCTGRASKNASPTCMPRFPRQFAIVDGIVGMEGNGPIQGTPKHAGVLVAGRDPVAVDATCCRIMRIDPFRDRLSAAGFGQPGLTDHRDQYTPDRRIDPGVRDAVRAAPDFRIFAWRRVDAAERTLRRNCGREPVRLSRSFRCCCWRPCYWQPRMQAGDLSSHIYNAWLAQLIESGRTQGLALVSQTTNILFDLMLERPVPPGRGRSGAAHRAFRWRCWFSFGAPSLLCGRSRTPALAPPALHRHAGLWLGLPHGLLQFLPEPGSVFLGPGAVSGNGRPRRMAAGSCRSFCWPTWRMRCRWCGPPACWCTVCVARRVYASDRILVTAMFVRSLIAGPIAIDGQADDRALVAVTDRPSATGLDQVWVFDSKYYLVLVGLLLVWGLLFLDLMRSRRPRAGGVGSIPFQFCVISAGGSLDPADHGPDSRLPSMPWSTSPSACRWGWESACAPCWAAARPRPCERWAMVAVAVLFFGFLFHATSGR